MFYLEFLWHASPPRCWSFWKPTRRYHHENLPTNPSIQSIHHRWRMLVSTLGMFKFWCLDIAKFCKFGTLYNPPPSHFPSPPPLQTHATPTPPTTLQVPMRVANFSVWMEQSRKLIKKNKKVRKKERKLSFFLDRFLGRRERVFFLSFFLFFLLSCFFDNCLPALYTLYIFWYF